MGDCKMTASPNSLPQNGWWLMDAVCQELPRQHAGSSADENLLSLASATGCITLEGGTEESLWIFQLSEVLWDFTKFCLLPVPYMVHWLPWISFPSFPLQKGMFYSCATSYTTLDKEKLISVLDIEHTYVHIHMHAFFLLSFSLVP